MQKNVRDSWSKRHSCRAAIRRRWGVNHLDSISDAFRTVFSAPVRTFHLRNSSFDSFEIHRRKRSPGWWPSPQVWVESNFSRFVCFGVRALRMTSRGLHIWYVAACSQLYIFLLIYLPARKEVVYFAIPLIWNRLWNSNNKTSSDF